MFVKEIKHQYDMNLEQSIRQIVCEELDKRTQTDTLIPLAQFCKEKNLNRVTVWRAEKEGRIKLDRIGKKIFVNQTQFHK